MIRSICGVAILVAGIALAPAPSAAQSVPARRARIPVTVVLDRDVAGRAFTLLRRVGPGPHDVIVLREDATPAELSLAVNTLVLVRRQTGDVPMRHALLRPASSARLQGRELPWAGRVIADLRRARVRAVPDVGSVRAVEIWLPPSRGRSEQ